MRISPPRQRGFTLIELMVVVVIISIITAVMAAEMGGTFQDALLRAATRQLVSTCNAAYGRAVATGSAHRVALDAETGQYVMERRRGRAFAPVEGNADARGAIDRRIHVEIHENGDRPAPPGAITFYPDGTADDCQIELSDRNGYARIVRVDPITARLQVVEAEPK